MLRGIPPDVPRAVRIDFQTAAETIIALEKVYVRDLHEEEISDEAIAGVNTAIRAIEGAMGKTANEVARRHCTRGARTYFPLTDNPARFPKLLKANLPGLKAKHPDIADAFERHQPYQQGREVLGHLKALYRENHHHDFTMQERRDEGAVRWQIFPGMELSIGQSTISIGSPGWKGIQVEGTAHAGPEGMEGMELRRGKWRDWYFVAPPVSVLGTLVDLYNRSAEACNDVSKTTGL